MQEMWQNTAKFYKKLKRRKAKLCNCLEQKYAGDFNASLHIIAKQIREPEQMYYSPDGKQKRYFYADRVYGGGGGRNQLAVARHGSKQPAIENIVDEATWKVWKNISSSNLDDQRKAEMASSFALFMKCNLKL